MFQKNLDKKEANRKYRLEHKEQLKEQQKKWRFEHKEQQKEWNKKYRLEHLEQIKARLKEYRQRPEVRERTKQQQKEWKEKNRNKLQYNRKYYETFKLKHPNYGKEQYEKHYERIIAYRNSHKEHSRELILKRNEEIMNILRIKIGEKCILCGISEKIHYHEIHGTRHRNDKQYYLNHLQDFIPLCSYCHNLIHKIARRKLSLEKIAEIIKKL